MRHQRGISLIEGLVTMSVATLIVTSALPSFHSMVERQRVRGVSDELRGDLFWLRSEAAAKGRMLSLTTAADGTCYVIYSGPPGACTCQADAAPVCEADAAALKSVTPTTSVKVTMASSKAKTLSYDPGTATMTPTGKLHVTAESGLALRLTVAITGRATTCAPAGGIPGAPLCKT